MAAAPEDVERARARRWWLGRRKITRIEDAARFIEDVGFALLFPWQKRLPALWPLATRSDDIDADWGDDEMRVWGWKDELALEKRAWYGPFLRGRKSFLSPALLAALYPREGKPDDFRNAALSKEARLIANILLVDGASSAAILREATGLRGSAFSKAVEELGRALVITHFGREDQAAGWPSAVYELTARAFRPKPKGSPDQRRRLAAERFLSTMIACRMPDLRYAFNWSAVDARDALDALVAKGRATAGSERGGIVYRTV